ncbi:MAG: hypothetical protein QF464_01160 [Myxococcota bacterium]|nr:hypothetical protein [Myxococcota bacterium]
MNANDTTNDRNAPRIAFLRAEVARDIEAEVASGINREWLTQIVADAAAELKQLTYVPSAADAALAMREEARMLRGYRRGRW